MRELRKEDEVNLLHRMPHAVACAALVVALAPGAHEWLVEHATRSVRLNAARARKRVGSPTASSTGGLRRAHGTRGEISC